MTPQKIAYFALILLFSSVVKAQTSSPCIYSDKATGYQYDLSSLHKETGWDVIEDGSDAGNKIGYYFNLCGTHPKQCRGKNVAAFETLENDTKVVACTVLGSGQSSEFSLLDSAKPQNGLQIMYSDGDICSGTKDSTESGKAKQVTFKIMCNHGEAPQVKRIHNPADADSSCRVEFQIYSEAGCPTVQSSGSLLSWIILLGVLYCLGMTTFNIISNKQSGAEAVPHLQQVKEYGKLTGLFILGGFMHLKEKIQNKWQSGSKSIASTQQGYAVV